MSAAHQRLNEAIAASQRSTLVLLGLLAVHGLPFHEFRLLLAAPPEVQHAIDDWENRMLDVVRLMGGLKGIARADQLSEQDRKRLLEEAFTKVMETPM